MINVPLERIQPNPWQTRQVLDEIHIRDLAADISGRKASRPATLGLLQVPAGRLIDADGKPVSLNGSGQAPPRLDDGRQVQLAYGHNRAEAFRLLAQGDGEAFPGDSDYGNLPLELVEFNDEAMATSAWTENEVRKDLTPIEEAQAIHNMMESFGWTQDQVAQRLGLNRSTIANKLRLLRLPDQVQDAMLQREITERQAVAMLPILNLPAPALEQIEQSPHTVKPAELLERAKAGHSSTDLRELSARAISYATRSFTLGNGVPFPLDHWFEVDDEQAVHLQSHQCSECLIRVKHEGELRCPDFACWDLKAELQADLRLTEAEAASSLPRLVPDGKYGSVETFYSTSDSPLVDEIVKDGCPRERLRLKFEHKPRAGALLEGFDDIRVVCHHGEGDRCHCLAAKKSAQTRERNQNDPELQARRKREKRVHDLAAPAYQALAQALASGHVGAWRLLLKRLNHSYSGKGPDWGLDKIALKVAAEVMSPDLAWNKDRPDLAQGVIASYFGEAGLDLPWPTPDPTAPIRRQLERIEGWFTTSVRHHPPSPQAIAGNQANLVRLIDNLEPLPPGKQGDKLAARIATLQLQLADVADVAQEWDFQDDAIEWNSYGNCLLTVPTDDPRFQRDVDQVTRPAVIRYAAALIGDGNGQADRLKALSTRLRLLENPKYAPRTHKQLADELHVPINAVAIVREILSGTSEMSQWALGLYDNDALGAARQLASSRCGTDPAVYDSITPEFVETIKMGAIVSCVPAH